jgi:aromatic-L-amino-acid decarboxylase
MNPDEFRQWGYRFVDWIAEYLAHPERYSVLPNVKPGEILGELPQHAPEAAESFDVMLRDLDRVILPGLTHWNHPSFFAYFPNTGSEPGSCGAHPRRRPSLKSASWTGCVSCWDCRRTSGA